MMPVSGQLSVPPGFRFHPTDEELLHYYLRKKVSYEAIDLDVIREVDLNKLEPWDLKDKCRIGSGPQNEWYLFSHKDKKYPTGTRTNRATAAGFWKATGRDKAIHLMRNSKRIGMRKTLVFYIGRAPHGQKTDWIMHEYRLDDENAELIQQEDGWVVCRVFKKKSNTSSCSRSGFFQHEDAVLEEEQLMTTHVGATGAAAAASISMGPKQNSHHALMCEYSFDGSMHLPQLLSPESAVVHPASFLSRSVPLSGAMDMECSNSNLLRLTSGDGGLVLNQLQRQEKLSSDWSFLDKLLASQQSFDQSKSYPFSQAAAPADHDHAVTSTHKFSFQYPPGSQSLLIADYLNFSK